MKKFKKARLTIGIILIGILAQILLPNPVSGAVLSDEEREIVADVQAQIPLSIQLTEEAIAVISNGWDGMNTEQQAEFQNIFDPGDTGEIDDAYLRDVVANYEKILAKLNGEMRIEYVTDSKKCTGCTTCMLACSLVHYGVQNPSRARIQIMQDSFGKFPNDIKIAPCRQ